MVLSIVLHLFRISKPHVAALGKMPGTEKILNFSRNQVVIDPEIVSLHVDASFYFLNARFLEDLINQTVADTPSTRHIILVCSAVNNIDVSAFDSFETINDRFKDSGIKFHLSEVRGAGSGPPGEVSFLKKLTGEVYHSQFEAVFSINPDLAQNTRTEKMHE